MNNKQKLTESSLCLLGTSSQKSLKLTLGSVAGPVKHDNRGETTLLYLADTFIQSWIYLDIPVQRHSDPLDRGPN